MEGNPAVNRWAEFSCPSGALQTSPIYSDICKDRWPRLSVARALLLWLPLAGCGYQVRTGASPDLKIHILAIPMLKNTTAVFQVEQRLTRALVEEFAKRSPYRVTATQAGADAAIEGEVVSVSAAPVIIGTASFGTTFLVTLSAHVRMVDLKTGRVLFRNDNYLFREQYVINNDVKQFFSEMNPALYRMARDFAQSVAASVLAGNQ